MIELPEPYYTQTLIDGSLVGCGVYTATQMHDYAALVCAEKDAEIERMREALVVLLANPTSELMKNIARAVLKESKS